MYGFLRYRANILIACVAAVAAVVLYYFDPSQSTFFPPCPSFSLTGLYCPGCGTTRALHALLHGDVARAARMNIGMLFAIPLVLLLLAKPRLQHSPRVSTGLLIVVVLYGIARNIPVYPFSLLAPH